jgi:hypothetical protein
MKNKGTQLVWGKINKLWTVMIKYSDLKKQTQPIKPR